ncbi:DUF4177 domain-containing protein [Phaeovulum sp. W22_SRMD_FR3]|uniref:DUF4177 domain-containing protein n=1 Tax=Phaeovulum sp. W22_SRMD_FR3 TaxID=3240274 RepID=UPI003F972D7C
MQHYEYRVVPAPSRGEKAKGLKTGAERYAHALSQLMNELAQDGWEYLRADTLPSEERSGLTSKTTVYHNLLVFRRPTAAALAPAMALEVAAAREQVVGTAPAASAPKLVAVSEPGEPGRKMLATEAPEGRAPRLGAATTGTQSIGAPHDDED